MSKGVNSCLFIYKIPNTFLFDGGLLMFLLSTYRLVKTLVFDEGFMRLLYSTYGLAKAFRLYECLLSYLCLMYFTKELVEFKGDI